MKLPKKPVPQRTPSLSIKAAIERAKHRKTTSLSKAAEKVQQGVPTGAVATKLWEGLVSSTFPQSRVMLTMVERSILRRNWEKHVGLGNNPNYYDLLEWTITHWTQIMAESFSGMTNPPELPAVRFWVKCLPQFIASYQRKQDVERFAQMTTREVMIAKLQQRGKDSETAEREVDERLGLTRLKREIKDEQEKLKRLQNQKATPHLIELQRKARIQERRATKDIDVDNELEQWV